MVPEVVARTGGSEWNRALPGGSQWQSAAPTENSRRISGNSQTSAALIYGGR